MLGFVRVLERLFCLGGRDVTGAAQMLLSQGSPIRLTGNSALATNTSLATGIRSGTIALAADGTFTQTGHAADAWATPTTAGIGAVWWVKLVASGSNTSFTGDSLSTWLQLTSGRSWSFANTATNNEGTGTGTFSFSPDGGTTTAGTAPMSWDVGFTP